MAIRRRTTVRRTRRRRTGRGFLSGLVNTFPPGSLSMMKKVFAPGAKTALGMGRRRRRPVRRVGRGIFGNGLNIASQVAGMLGLGRRRRRVGRPRVRRVRRVGRPRVRRTGRGLWDSIKSLAGKAHNFVRSNKLVSKGLNHFGYRRAGSLAHMAGYGRARPASRRMIRF